MPFEKSPKTLDGLIEKAIVEDQQLRESLEEVGFEGREIYEEIEAASGSIWEVALDEIKKYELAERDYTVLGERSVKEAGDEPIADKAKLSVSGVWLRGLLGVSVLGVLSWGSYQLYEDWHQAVGALETLRGLLVVGAGVLLIAALGWGIIRIQNSSQAARNADLQRRHDEWLKKKSMYGVEAAGAALQTEGAAIEKLLFERVRQEMISAINRRTAPSYVPRLEVKRLRGFGEIFDKRFTIQTPARRRLQFMLQNMPGGSIGIAGSRGAGKTTLIRLFCGPKRVIDKLNGKPVLGVLVSAPVAYQAREFILYLFSSACQNVIEAERSTIQALLPEGGKYVPPGLPADAPPTPLQNARVFVAVLRLPHLLIRFGLALSLLSLLVALGLAALQSSPSVESATPHASSLPAATNQTPATPSPPQPREAGRPAPGPVDKPSPEPQGLETPGANTQQATKNDSASLLSRWLSLSLVSRWLSLLKIDPAPWVVWGGTLTMIGLMLAKFLGLNLWRTFLYSLALLNDPRGRRSPWWFEEDARVAPGVDSLSEHAETWLKAIKFQQSYTSGWSGSLKLPIGLEGGVNRAVSLAQNQLSLPEICYFFSRFLEEASLKYQVIIGIDEMDKLATDDLAQQFLNDIKSIFGVERCFYLVSVSENAMSNFERRGLPFRDVFDSAFDDFVYVDYLDFESAKELLEQRVVGRPILFFAMSYCMSGGLPRDLIRNFRSVLEVYEQDKDHNSLTAICRKVVASDLVAKLRATRTAAKKIKLELEVERFLEMLYELEVGVDSDQLLVKKASALLATAGTPDRVAEPAPVPRSARAKPGTEKFDQSGVQSAAELQKSDEDPDDASNVSELRTLSEELATYFCYAVTLRQLFNDELSQTALTTPPLNGSLDVLAKARQALGINPAITRALLKAFRDAHGLEAFA
jgi:hypothetical protein